MHPGARIRKLRRQQGATLQQIADRCGFTRSLLSKIETGKSSPPIATLMKIADALGVKLLSLLDSADNQTTVFTPAHRAAPAEMTVTDKGYAFYAYASERGNKEMQPFLFIAEKGKVDRKALSHSGEEFVYVLEGRMKYRVGAVEYSLGPGDSLYFDALDEHDLEPVTERVVYLGIFQALAPGSARDNDVENEKT